MGDGTYFPWGIEAVGRDRRCAQTEGRGKRKTKLKMEIITQAMTVKEVELKKESYRVRVYTNSKENNDRIKTL